VNIVADGENNSLDFFWQADGSTTWSGTFVAGSGTTYSTPVIIANNGSSNIVAEGPLNQLMFYWNINKSSQWTPESVPGAYLTNTPAITTNGTLAGEAR
jgi:hypothetical protein